MVAAGGLAVAVGELDGARGGAGEAAGLAQVEHPGGALEHDLFDGGGIQELRDRGVAEQRPPASSQISSKAS